MTTQSLNDYLYLKKDRLRFRLNTIAIHNINYDFLAYPSFLMHYYLMFKIISILIDVLEFVCFWMVAPELLGEKRMKAKRKP